MTYTTFTVWSRGRLLGETTLGFERIFPLSRMGWLIPDESGLKVIPQVTTCDVSTATGELVKLYRKVENDDDKGTKKADLLRHTTEYADLAAAETHADAFGLELRRTDGSVIPTEWIAIQDTHRLIALGEAWRKEFEESGEEIDPEIEEMAAKMYEEWKSEHEGEAWKSLEESEEVELPRYQVMVELLNEFDIP